MKVTQVGDVVSCVAVSEQPAGAWHAGSDSAGCAQVNVLNYLQSIIGGQATANPVMDSPITGLIVQMLRAPQQGAFQVLLATILGLLVRHCTFIPAELAECGEPLLLSSPTHICGKLSVVCWTQAMTLLTAWLKHCTLYGRRRMPKGDRPQKNLALLQTILK